MSSGISGDLTGESRLLLESMGRTGETPLVPGQRLPARVIEMLLTGEAVLELGRGRATVPAKTTVQGGDGTSNPTATSTPWQAGARVTVPTSTPLQPGDRVRLEVVTAGPTPEFRIVSDAQAPAQASASPKATAPATPGAPTASATPTRSAGPTGAAISAGSATPATPATPVLVAGQRLAARVSEMVSTGQAVAHIAGSRVVVPVSRPMQAGERVVLEVISGGANPELRMVAGKTAAPAPASPRTSPVPPPAAASPQATAGPTVPPALTPRDLPVIMRALAEMPANAAGVSIAQAAQSFLRAAVAADAHPAVVDQMQRMLAPLQAAVPPAELAQTLRAFLAQSGLFTENQLAAALREQLQPQAQQPQQNQQNQQQSGSLAAEQRQQMTADQRPQLTTGQPPHQHHQTQQPQVSADARLLLGALTKTVEGHGQPQNQPVDAHVSPGMPGTPVTPAMPAADAVRVFGEALLQQQLVVAEQLAATGGGQIAIPVMFGEERVDIRFTWDREARQEKEERAEPDGDRAISLGVFVNLNVFGAIEARINWKPDSFAVTFYVERESTRAIVEAGLNELSAELSASGFSAVTMNVWLNPDRVSAGVTAGATPVRPALRAGTILDVMA